MGVKIHVNSIGHFQRTEQQEKCRLISSVINILKYDALNYVTTHNLVIQHLLKNNNNDNNNNSMK